MKLVLALGGALLAATVLASMTSPASALGGCGPNGHRGPGGRCFRGGQDQAWCLRHYGHRAVRAPNGQMICIRRGHR